MSAFRKRRLFCIPVILLLILLLSSCKTCDCPAYTSVPGPFPAPEALTKTCQNVVCHPEVSFLQTHVISGTTAIPYPGC